MEQYPGKPTDLSRLKVFGCAAYVHVRKHDRGKFDVHANLCIFVGCNSQTKVIPQLQSGQNKGFCHNKR